MGTRGGGGSEAGSYVRLIDFVYQSTLGLRVSALSRLVARSRIERTNEQCVWDRVCVCVSERERNREKGEERENESEGMGKREKVGRTLGLNVIKKKKSRADRVVALVGEEAGGGGHRERESV